MCGIQITKNDNKNFEATFLLKYNNTWTKELKLEKSTILVPTHCLKASPNNFGLI